MACKAGTWAEGAAAEDALMVWTSQLKLLPQKYRLHSQEKINKN